MIRRLLQLFFDIILKEKLDIIGPIIGVGSFSPAYRRDLFPIVIDLFYFLHYLGSLLVAQIREKLLYVWKLLDRYLIIELLVVRAVVLIILRNNFLFTFFLRVAIDLLLLLLILMELELAARTSSR